MSNIKNTADLRGMLLDVIGDVRKGKIEASQAKAISSLASQVLISARLDLDALKSASDNKKVGATLLTYDDDIIRSPYDDLTDEEYRQILDMKNNRKSLAAICEKMKDMDKKLIAAAYHGRQIDDPDYA